MGTTNHAKKRMKQRAGLSGSITNTNSRNAYHYGITLSETTGKLYDYLQNQSFKHSSSMRLYRGKIYAFRNDILITLMDIPDNLMAEYRSYVDPAAYWRYAYITGKRHNTLNEYTDGRKVFFMDAPYNMTIEARLSTAVFLSSLFSYKPVFKEMTTEGEVSPIPEFADFIELDRWFNKKFRISYQKYLYGHSTDVCRSIETALYGTTTVRTLYYEMLHKRNINANDWDGRKQIADEMNQKYMANPCNMQAFEHLSYIREIARERQTLFEYKVIKMHVKAVQAAVMTNARRHVPGLVKATAKMPAAPAVKATVKQTAHQDAGLHVQAVPVPAMINAARPAQEPALGAKVHATIPVRRHVMETVPMDAIRRPLRRFKIKQAEKGF